MGGMVLANNHESQENSHPVPAWGMGLMVMVMRFSVVFIGRACVAGLVGVLHEVPGAIEKELGPSAVCLKSEAASHSPKENRPDHAGVESEELQVVRSRHAFFEVLDTVRLLLSLPPRQQGYALVRGECTNCHKANSFCRRRLGFYLKNDFPFSNF